MHKLCHVAKINFATCINIKTFILDDGYYIKKNSFHFLEMHKLCHVTMCNWLLQNLHIMINSLQKIIWSKYMVERILHPCALC